MWKVLYQTPKGVVIKLYENESFEKTHNYYKDNKRYFRVKHDMKIYLLEDDKHEE